MTELESEGQQLWLRVYKGEGGGGKVCSVKDVGGPVRLLMAFSLDTWEGSFNAKRSAAVAAWFDAFWLGIFSK